MVKLASSQDVQTVSPRVTTDPGVKVPQGAFDTVGNDVGLLTPGAEAMTRSQAHQENRRYTVDRADKELKFRQDAEDKFRELNTSQDFSDDRVLQEYSKFLADQRIRYMNEHAGNEDSKARLYTNLHAIQSDWEGKSAAASVTIGRQKAIDVFDQKLNPIIATVASNPTASSINEAMLRVGDLMEDSRGAFNPNEEHAMEAGARELVALTGLNALISSGRPEAAMALLENADLSSAMSSKTNSEVRSRIEKIRSTRDEITNRIHGYEAMIGRRATQDEIQAFYGLAPKISERDKRTQQLTERGLSRQLAQDIAAGDVEIKGPDEFGNYVRTNKVNGSVEQLGDSDNAAIDLLVRESQGKAPQGGQQPQRPQAGQPGQPAQPAAAPQQPQQAQQAPQSGQVAQPSQQAVPTKDDGDIGNLIDQGVGPIAKIQETIANVIGPFVEGAMFPETTDAKQAIRTFNQMAKTGLVNNPKFPVAETKVVSELLPEPDAFFKDPDTARRDMKKLKSTLEGYRDSKINELATGKKITQKRKGELYDQVSRISELLEFMTQTAKQGKKNSASQPQRPEGIPEDYNLVGKSKRGNDVWESPDGKRKLEVVPDQ